MALTVLGRPPGLAQIPLSEAESEMLGVSISSPNSPAAERPYSPQDRFSSTHPSLVRHDLPMLPSISCLYKLTLHLCPPFSSSWRFSPWLSIYLCALILVVASLYLILFFFFFFKQICSMLKYMLNVCVLCISDVSNVFLNTSHL